MGLSFVCAARPCQRNLSRVRVPWDLRPHFTVSDLILPISSPLTTRRVAVEVFDPASTRVTACPSRPVMAAGPLYIASARTAQKTPLLTVTPLFRVTQPLPSNDCFLGSKFLWVIYRSASLKHIPRITKRHATLTNGPHRTHLYKLHNNIMAYPSSIPALSLHVTCHYFQSKIWISLILFACLSSYASFNTVSIFVPFVLL
jgi:hypothetical protein